ncbi:MAG: AsmA-like C-terminal region-containing protein, partial [Gammaproteobacteria bacterium]
LNANAALDVRQATPVWRGGFNLQNVKLGDLLQDYAGDRYLSGLTQASAQISTQGNRISALRGALGGNVSFKITDGSIQDSKLAQNILTAEAVLKGKPVPAGGFEPSKFSTLSGTGAIQQGVLNNQDLQLLTPGWRAKGAGKVDLVRNRVDYVLSVGELKPDTRWLPIRISGPFAKLNYQLQLDKMVEQAAKQEAKKAVQKEVEKQKQKLQQDLQKGLQDLFKLK